MTIEDSEFGLLTWNDEFLLWEGKATISDGTSVKLWIGTPASGQRPDIAKQNPDRTITPEARNAFRMLLGIPHKLQERAAADLFSVYNETWNQTGVSLTRSEFIAAIQFDQITVYADGTSEVWFSDADLFMGHAIRIPVNADGSMPHGAMLEG